MQTSVQNPLLDLQVSGIVPTSVYPDKRKFWLKADEERLSDRGGIVEGSIATADIRWGINGLMQCLNCEKRSGGTLEARRRGERRRRENRGSVGAEGEGNGFPPPQPTRESGEKWHGDQTRREKFLNGRPRMLTCDLFAVAKILVDH